MLPISPLFSRYTCTSVGPTVTRGHCFHGPLFPWHYHRQDKAAADKAAADKAAADKAAADKAAADKAAADKAAADKELAKPAGSQQKGLCLLSSRQWTVPRRTFSLSPWSIKPWIWQPPNVATDSYRSPDFRAGALAKTDVPR